MIQNQSIICNLRGRDQSTANLNDGAPRKMQSMPNFWKKIFIIFNPQTKQEHPKSTLECHRGSNSKEATCSAGLIIKKWWQDLVLLKRLFKILLEELRGRKSIPQKKHFKNWHPLVWRLKKTVHRKKTSSSISKNQFTVRNWFQVLLRLRSQKRKNVFRRKELAIPSISTFWFEYSFWQMALNYLTL